MASLEQALHPTGIDKMQPVEPSKSSAASVPITDSPGASPFGRGPVPGVAAMPDNLRQFYRAPGIPQYRCIPPPGLVGTVSSAAKAPKPAPSTTIRIAAGSGTVSVLPIFVFDEIPDGTIDGTTGSDGNDTFTLAHAPNPASFLVLTKNGQQLYAGIGFTLVGNTITYAATYIPVVGDVHRAAIYRY